MDTKKKTKIFMIAVCVLFASYAVHSTVLTAVQVASYQKQKVMLQARQAQRPQVQPVSTAAPTAPASAPQISQLSGVWEGRASVEEWGLCDLRFELREKETGKFTGYSKLSCLNMAAVLEKQKKTFVPPIAPLTSLNPDTAILSGALESGAIDFKVDKAFSADVNGCPLSSMTITPFSGELNAEWQAGACHPGHMLLQRIAK
jgi:hypothetical protein